MDAIDHTLTDDDGAGTFQKTKRNSVVYPVGSSTRRKNARQHTARSRKRQRVNGQTIGGTHKRRGRRHG